jgi:hypothetical protein
MCVYHLYSFKPILEKYPRYTTEIFRNIFNNYAVTYDGECCKCKV